MAACAKYWGVGDVGRFMIAAGLMLVLAGGVLLASQHATWLRIGRLPGDINIHKNGFSFYFPFTTMILASLLISAILWLIGRLRT